MLEESSIARFATLMCLLAFSIASPTNVSETAMEIMEDSTVSPIADMAIIESEMRTSTERPPTVEQGKENENKNNSQRITVADFIIHPLIALQPRNPEDGAPAQGKQATNTNTTAIQYPWQLFNFTPGQGIISSSVSSLAGSVSNWINDRLQFPGLVDTPVRELTTTSTTTTTTTPRPDIVVKVKHKATTRRPLISIVNNLPNFDSAEVDDEEDYEENDELEFSNEGGDNEEIYENDNEEEDEAEENDLKEAENEEENENIDDEEEEEQSQRPNHRRKPLRNNKTNRRRVVYNRQRPYAPLRRITQDTNDDSEEEEVGYDYSDDELDNDTSDDQYYSTKRSQSSPNFFQRGQQQLIKQIRQLTRAQTPKEIGTAIRKAQRKSGLSGHRNQGTLFVNRNGKPIYIAPELSQLSQPQYQKVYAQSVVGTGFPQPPLTKPLRLKGEPVQYITIPWARLGISPPRSAVAIAEGIQSKPLILNIPQSAINAMQSESQSGKGKRKKKRPQLITAEAVPILAEASLMDIFKGPDMPPSRTSNSKKPIEQVESQSSADFMPENKPDKDDFKTSENTAMASSSMSKNEEKQYITVGKDDEPGLTRQVEPVYGGEQYLAGSPQYVRRRFAIDREGRSLSVAEESSLANQQQSNSKVTESLIKDTPNIESPKQLGERTHKDTEPKST